MLMLRIRRLNDVMSVWRKVLQQLMPEQAEEGKPPEMFLSLRQRDEHPVVYVVLLYSMIKANMSHPMAMNLFRVWE